VCGTSNGIRGGSVAHFQSVLTDGILRRQVSSYSLTQILF